MPYTAQSTPVPPTFTPIPPRSACIPTMMVANWAKSESVGGLIRQLDEAFATSGGAIGMSYPDRPFQIQDPGPAGAAVLWTNTFHRPFKVLTPGQTVDRTVFKVLTQGSWGTYVVFTAVEVPSPGRWARLCDRISDLMAVFPDATSAVNP